MYFTRSQRRINEYEYSRKLSPKSYNLSAMRRVGEISFGKRISEKFRKFVASKNYAILVKKVCVYCKRIRVEFLFSTSLTLNLIKKLKLVSAIIVYDVYESLILIFLCNIGNG